MKARQRERDSLVFYKKIGKNLSKNFNFHQKGPSCKKLKNLGPESQETLKCVLKGKYAERQGLFGKKPYYKCVFVCIPFVQCV